MNGYIVDVAVIDKYGNILFNSLVNPQVPISPGAQQTHGITDADVALAPTLPLIWPHLMRVLSNYNAIITYNVSFDRNILESDASRYGLSLPTCSWQCLMMEYSEHVGEWSDYHGNYRWQKLPGGNHRALGDCQAALQVLKEMADGCDEDDDWDY